MYLLPISQSFFAFLGLYSTSPIFINKTIAEASPEFFQKSNFLSKHICIFSNNA